MPLRDTTIYRVTHAEGDDVTVVEWGLDDGTRRRLRWRGTCAESLESVQRVVGRAHVNDHVTLILELAKTFYWPPPERVEPDVVG